MFNPIYPSKSIKIDEVTVDLIKNHEGREKYLHFLQINPQLEMSKKLYGLNVESNLSLDLLNKRIRIFLSELHPDKIQLDQEAAHKQVTNDLFYAINNLKDECKNRQLIGMGNSYMKFSKLNIKPIDRFFDFIKREQWDKAYSVSQSLPPDEISSDPSILLAVCLMTAKNISDDLLISSKNSFGEEVSSILSQFESWKSLHNDSPLDQKRETLTLFTRVQQLDCDENPLIASDCVLLLKNFLIFQCYHSLKESSKLLKGQEYENFLRCAIRYCPNSKCFLKQSLVDEINAFLKQGPELNKNEAYKHVLDRLFKDIINKMKWMPLGMYEHDSKLTQFMTRLKKNTLIQQSSNKNDKKYLIDNIDLNRELNHGITLLDSILREPSGFLQNLLPYFFKELSESNLQQINHLKKTLMGMKGLMDSDYINAASYFLSTDYSLGVAIAQIKLMNYNQAFLLLTNIRQEIKDLGESDESAVLTFVLATMNDIDTYIAKSSDETHFNREQPKELLPIELEAMRLRK
ncbi:MAG: hypothetical protein QRY72_04920 [Candidatus Rhabdochlamydia sp.]